MPPPDEQIVPPAPLTFATVSRANRLRCERWHPGFPNDKIWNGGDWGNALAGETGEACNIVKKLRRLEAGYPDRDHKESADRLADLANEIADVYLYLDLLAQYYGLSVEACLPPKFNAVSLRQGFPERLP
jgi:NTP pyrophosphatase (non-canonical NTP hydrolase)